MAISLTASLVLYNSDPAVFEVAIQSFLSGSDSGVLAVLDNSPTPIKSRFFDHPRVRYVFNGKNVGFGAAHNIAFKRVAAGSDFHLILNPDISFCPAVLDHLLAQMENDPGIGAIMPQIRYPHGEIQRLCKLLPNPIDLIARRFIPFSGVVNMLNRRYELHALPHVGKTQIPSLSGCFLLVRSDLYARVGGFDERFFMYMEDIDLVRRVGDLGATVYDPAVFVIHAFEKGSYKNPVLLKYHLQSAFKYFNKWGWLFDAVRRARNKTILAGIRSRD